VSGDEVGFCVTVARMDVKKAEWLFFSAVNEALAHASACDKIDF
jgi:hypothetical protein